jgi:hypothetical protein
MASSRKIDDFSSYQDFILFLTTSPQQLHGAHRRMSPRAAASRQHPCGHPGSIHDHAAARGGRASERSMRAYTAWRARRCCRHAAAAAWRLMRAGCPSVDFCNRRARFTQAARKSVWPLSPFWSVSYGAVPIWRGPKGPCGIPRTP